MIRGQQPPYYESNITRQVIINIVARQGKSKLSAFLSPHIIEISAFPKNENLGSRDFRSTKAQSPYHRKCLSTNHFSKIFPECKTSTSMDTWAKQIPRILLKNRPKSQKHKERDSKYRLVSPRTSLFNHLDLTLQHGSYIVVSRYIHGAFKSSTIYGQVLQQSAVLPLKKCGLSHLSFKRNAIVTHQYSTPIHMYIFICLSQYLSSLKLSQK